MPHVNEIDHVNRYRIRWDDSFARIAKEKQRRHEDDSVDLGEKDVILIMVTKGDPSSWGLGP